MEIDDVLAADDCVGVITRDVRVRLVNISTSGCLIESSARLEPGTAGELRIRVDGQVYADSVRIARVQQVHGAGSTWQIGAEFLWTTQPGTQSLRRVVGRMRHALTQQAVDVEFSSRLM